MYTYIAYYIIEYYNFLFDPRPPASPAPPLGGALSRGAGVAAVRVGSAALAGGRSRVLEGRLVGGGAGSTLVGLLEELKGGIDGLVARGKGYDYDTPAAPHTCARWGDRDRTCFGP